MARGKIAPTLTRYMGPGVLLSEWDIGRKVAVAELRALLAVARAARAWADVAPCETRFMQIESNLVRAVARLDHASGRASGAKGGGR